MVYQSLKLTKYHGRRMPKFVAEAWYNIFPTYKLAFFPAVKFTEEIYLQLNLWLVFFFSRTKFSAEPGPQRNWQQKESCKI